MFYIDNANFTSSSQPASVSWSPWQQASSPIMLMPSVYIQLSNKMNAIKPPNCSALVCNKELRRCGIWGSACMT